MRRPRLLALVALVGGLATLLSWQGSPRAQQPPLAVSTPLPAWRAPGGRLLLAGTASPGQTVALVAGVRRLGLATVNAGGRFTLRARAPGRAGSYRLLLDPGDPAERIEIGRLKVRPLRLAAVGDVNLGDRPGRAIAAYGPRYPWRSVRPVLRSADLAIANLECAVSRRGAPVPKEYTFRGSPAALRSLARYAGIDVVSLANNHSLDYGRVAFADTLANARATGLVTVGGGRNLAAARRPKLFRLGGLRVAILGFSDVRPLGFDAGPSLSGTAPAFASYVLPGVRAARRRADVVVVYYHWGTERAFSASARQRGLASLAFRAGADVVLGAHPHVLQPIERLRGGRLVAWSLGNFVFGANSPATERTGVLRLGLGARGVVGWSFRRARIGGPFGIQPRLSG